MSKPCHSEYCEPIRSRVVSLKLYTLQSSFRASWRKLARPEIQGIQIRSGYRLEFILSEAEGPV